MFLLAFFLSDLNNSGGGGDSRLDKAFSTYAREEGEGVMRTKAYKGEGRGSRGSVRTHVKTFLKRIKE